MTHLGADASGGSYACFIRPNLDEANSDEWFRFSDESVRLASAEEAMEKSFGGVQTAPVAYMLIYVKKQHKETLFKPVNDADVADHIKKSTN